MLHCLVWLFPSFHRKRPTRLQTCCRYGPWLDFIVIPSPMILCISFTKYRWQEFIALWPPVTSHTALHLYWQQNKLLSLLWSVLWIRMYLSELLEWVLTLFCISDVENRWKTSLLDSYPRDPRLVKTNVNCRDNNAGNS